MAKRIRDWSNPVEVEGYYDEVAYEAAQVLPICWTPRGKLQPQGWRTGCGQYVQAPQSTSNASTVTCPACQRLFQGVK